MKLPVYSQMVDWEVELAAIIGRPARNVPESKALNYVAGYTIGDAYKKSCVPRSQTCPTSRRRT